MKRLEKLKKVYIQFPKTGLGNMLLVWARAIVFSELNHASCVCGTWWGLRWGALLRRENKKRLYYGYFKESHWRDRLQTRLAMVLQGRCYDPPVSKLTGNQFQQVVVFHKVVTDPDLFGGLREHRDLIKHKLLQLLVPALRQRLETFEAPVIGVHIRRGDFTLSRQATPLAYFVGAVNCIRDAAGVNLPVTIFTDADPSELETLLALDHISVASTGADILDILLLSKSRILLLSRDSTFGYWAAFLSRALVILRQDDWQAGIRKPSAENPEIKLNLDDKHSVKSLQALISHLKFDS